MSEDATLEKPESWLWHLLGLINPAIVMASNIVGGFWVASGVIYMLGLGPLLDVLFGRASKPKPPLRQCFCMYSEIEALRSMPENRYRTLSVRLPFRAGMVTEGPMSFLPFNGLRAQCLELSVCQTPSTRAVLIGSSSAPGMPGTLRGR